jgi:predicted DNA binding CopG/RHH family protein
MAQNRNKLIDLFISNLSNAVLHRILEKAISDIEIMQKYSKEIKNSWQIALNYREKINPIDMPLPNKDIEEIKRRASNRVKSDLLIRISKGYKNIDISLIDQFINNALKELRAI